jgi:hypothetical protein
MKLTPKEKTEENGKSPRIGGFRGLEHLGKQVGKQVNQNWRIYGA